MTAPSADPPPRLAADAAVDLIAARISGGCRLVVVDGFSASGKSTVAAAVAARAGRRVTVVRGDDFIRRGTTRWDQRRLIDDLLAPLSRGDDAAYRPWPWDADEPGPLRHVPADSVIVLEGIAVSDLDTRGLDVGVPLVVWVEADERERARRSRDRAPQRFACWRDDWLAIEREWGERVRPWARADIVVATGSPRP